MTNGQNNTLQTFTGKVSHCSQLHRLARLGRHDVMLTDTPLKFQTFPERINNFIFFNFYEFSEFRIFYFIRIGLICRFL